MSKIETIFEQLSELKLPEVVELVEKMKSEWGISLDVPVAVAAAPAGEAGPSEEEKSEFNIVLEGFNGENKIGAIKEVRAFTQLGLGEAKQVVEECSSSAKEILVGIAKDKANEIKTKLEAVGLKVRLA